MHLRSALAGAAASVLVAGGVFAAVAASNAQEPEVVEPVAVVELEPARATSLDSPDPITYTPPAPEPAPEPVATVEPEPVVAPEPVVEEPVVVQPEPQPEPKPAPAPASGGGGTNAPGVPGGGGAGDVGPLPGSANG